MPEIERRIRHELKIPTVTFDGDQADPRVFSEAQHVTRVEALTEIMAANKAEMKRRHLMKTLTELFDELQAVVDNPVAQLEVLFAVAKRLLVVFRIYPNEIVYAAGMVPFGIWGAEGRDLRSEEIFSSFLLCASAFFS